MAAAIGVRGADGADDLRRVAKRSRDATQTRRLLAVAAIYDGGLRSVAARIGGVGLQTVRDWVVRFNAEGPEGLIDRKAAGKAPPLTAAQRRALSRAVEAGPKPCLDGVVRWRLADLAQWLWDAFGVSASRQTLGRELRAMGFTKLSARPQHLAQDSEAIEAFKKTSPASWRIGRKNRITRRWARRGTRPRAPQDRRTKTGAPSRPTSSAPTARRRARVPGWSCPGATPTRW